jgi:hypothetical protein
MSSKKETPFFIYPFLSLISRFVTHFCVPLSGVTRLSSVHGLSLISRFVTHFCVPLSSVTRLSSVHGYPVYMVI